MEKIVWTKIATKKFDNFCPGGQIKKIKILYYIKYPIINIKKCLNFFDLTTRAEIVKIFRCYFGPKMTQKRHFEIIWPFSQCFLVLNVCSFYFVEKMVCWSTNVRIVDFFPSALELLKIPSDLDFHKDFKYINKSSVRIKLREIFMILGSGKKLH